MSLRGLSNGCPACGDKNQSFFLIKHDDGPCFAKGYSCGVCGHYWDARFSDKLDHPEEYVPYVIREAAGIYEMPEQASHHWCKAWLMDNNPALSP